MVTRLIGNILALVIMATGASAQLQDVPKVQSGVWEGYCSSYGRCSAGINKAYFTAKVGALSFNPTFNLIYESKHDQFVLSVSLFYTPPGTTIDLRRSHILLPNGKMRFTEQRHNDAGRNRMTTNIAATIRRKDRRIRDIMSYLAKANTVRVHLAYKYGGKLYEGPVDFSLRGSSRVLTTVYGQFDDPDRTFEAGRQGAAQRNREVTWEKRSCNRGMFNWCVFTDDPEGTAALVSLGLLAGRTMAAIAPMAERGAAIVGTYECTISCSDNNFGQTDVRVTVGNVDFDSAYNHVSVNGARICRQAVGGLSTPGVLAAIRCDLR